MSNVTALQRRILAVLEEAGEDNVSALINTVKKCCGCIEEIETASRALTDLAKSGILNLAKVRDDASRRWIPLASEESISLLTNLQTALEWSAIERIWTWQGDEPLPRVVLTRNGCALAQQVLSEDGYPSDL